ncbi:MAG: methyltransferase domain-containing protein [Niastella sp.]|nr:methyltransferase domain-containing protein [Niastella sp.]
MNFQIRSYQKELLDRDDIPFADIKRNMQELDFINTWLGGHAITLEGFRRLSRNQLSISVCEIGCGGGDNLAAIARWCEKRKIFASFTGIDKNPDCIAVAKERNLPGSTWIASDYKDVVFDRKPDIIFSSLFCHHFPERELIAQMRWMYKHAHRGFFINDLHRHPMAYYSIQWLTRLFSKSYLVQHDAPLSVARGFVKKDWQLLFDSAGITTFSVQWKWAFRWLVVVDSSH